MNKKSFLVLLVAASSILQAQVSQQWVARYNGPGNGDDFPNALTVDAASNVYVTGWGIGVGTGSDYTTIKYNSSGIEQWVQRYNGSGNGEDHAYSVAVDGSGNVYVSGSSYNVGSYLDIVTVKYNTSGVQQWIQTYNGPGNGNDGAVSVALDGQGNIIIGGWSNGGSSGLDYVVMKYDPNGIVQWIQRYNGPGNGDDYITSMAVDVSGSIFVTGGSTGIGTGIDYTTIKYNSSGVQQWVRRYNYVNAGNDNAKSIAVDRAGNSFVTGYFYVPTTQYNYATLKYDSAGTQQWGMVYYGPGNHYWSYEYAYSAAVDTMGNVFVTGGSTNSPGTFDYAYCTIKYFPNGNTAWTQRFDGPGVFDDIAYSLTTDVRGDVYVTGESGASETSFDYATLKYSNSGVPIWTQRYNGPANDTDVAYRIAVDQQQNVYVIGWSRGVGSAYDYATIKYSQPTAISPVSSEIPNRFQLYQNYPNPFNPSTKIRFDIPSSAGLMNQTPTKLVIYDALGREVSTLVNETLKAGSYEVEWNASNYTSGVYFYKLTSGDFIQTKKLILIK